MRNSPRSLRTSIRIAPNLSDFMTGLSASAPQQLPVPAVSSRTRVGHRSRRSVQLQVAQWEQAALHDDQLGVQVAQQGEQELRRSSRNIRPPERYQVEGPSQVSGLSQQGAAALSDDDDLIVEEEVDQNRASSGNGEQMELADRLQPEIPAPSDIIVEDSDGWSSIDRLGAWNAFLCEFQVLEEVPAQHKGMWVWAWATVLQRLQAADVGKEQDRALMWLCFLPQALLRKAKRGGRAGRKLVAQRFNSLVNGDWGHLVSMWEKDKRLAREEKQQRHRRSEGEEDDLDRKTRQTVDLISRAAENLNCLRS